MEVYFFRLLVQGIDVGFDGEDPQGRGFAVDLPFRIQHIDFTNLVLPVCNGMAARQREGPVHCRMAERNRQVGIALGQGRSVEEITSGMRMIAEGIRTTQSAVELARKLKVEMPIAEKMYSVLYEGLHPETALRDLMERKLREE